MLTFDRVYIVTYLLQTYFVFCLFRTLKGRHGSFWIEAAAYICYYAVVIHVYLAADAAFYHLIVNGAALYALSWLYERNWKRNLACAAAICFVLMLSEVMGVLLSTAAIRSVLRHTNVVLKLGLFLRCIVMFALVQLIKQWRAVRDGDYVPWGYWVFIPLVLCCSVYFILSWAGTVSDLRFVWNTILVVIMNFMMVFLSDSLIVSMRKNNRNILIEEQNQSYARELQLVMESHHSVRVLRHDLKNHTIALMAMMNAGNYEKAGQYLQQLYNEIEGSQKGGGSGNIAVDSMIDYKREEASGEDIMLDTDIQIPVDLAVTPFDLSVILGNLLDNAITAVRNVPAENRRISLEMKLRQNCLYIHVENPYMGKLRMRKNVLLTTKEKKSEHGLGIQSVKKVISRYNGEIHISGEKGLFNVNIILFL